ncbi:hypothetical protein E8E11_004565 [Didymella keratinophila]|nr:hypothetical protein E8E11_004565 [Didymella keratinophila]
MLRNKGIIHKDTDIYEHFLEDLLDHTKTQLQQSNELHPKKLLQFVLCVPAKWPVSACRVMQEALEKAVKVVGLSENAQEDVCNLFMISEPEAAAECILAEAKVPIHNHDTVVVLDAGGGTIDAVTYKCINSDPVRLNAEVVAPESDLLGASYINEEFEKKLLQKVASETYLWEDRIPRKSLKSIVQALTNRFETYEKRFIDVMRPKKPIFRVKVEDLRENKYRKGFRCNLLELRQSTVKQFFGPSMEKAKEVLEGQLDLAEYKNQIVEKVILTGGFGQSPSLQSYLREYLVERERIKGRHIDLIVPKNPSTAVARGAVLRALNKRVGPSRVTQCSYGFIADGERYVDETIRWVLQA